MCKDRYFYYQEQLCVVMEPILLVPVHQVLKYNYDYGPDGYFEGNAATINSCCFTSLNLSTYRSNYYYTTIGSTCQSCSGDA